jgi:hypothetical protein
MSFNFPLDNHTYTERRMRDADEAEARIDVVSAQAARRYVAIDQAIRRIRAVEQLNKSCTLTRANLSELLEELARELETANQVRATDAEVAE